MNNFNFYVVLIFYTQIILVIDKTQNRTQELKYSRVLTLETKRLLSKVTWFNTKLNVTQEVYFQSLFRCLNVWKNKRISLAKCFHKVQKFSTLTWRYPFLISDASYFQYYLHKIKAILCTALTSILWKSGVQKISQIMKAYVFF